MYAPNASYLRVYEPAGAFVDADYWRAYAASGRAVDIHEGPRVRREALYERIGWPWRSVPAFGRDAYVIDRGEADPLICPWNLRYRIAASALEVRRLTPEAVAEALIPPEFLASATEVVAHDEGSDRREAPADAHEQVASWSVPLRWFACVRPEDRQLVIHPRATWLRYRTPMARARTGLVVARNLVRAEFGEGADLAEALAETRDWLDGFHHDSIVELDYGGIVSGLDYEELRREDSVDLTWESLDYLGAGDVESAQDCYMKLIERWRDRRLTERLN
ncbi:hypothetical protein [Glycomyces buryatensis]|uniref:DUF8083 domain-containing protein n=1 Tax=Glycomyces buryatensis TaxID=2570927 RepID=A0A4S8QD68_9ACTN|nr:hypothetical protein [Glycomyces buryatensis]THV41561.1 hypothetical protein FAB82_10655 [Glycomyces buryatensis]